MNTYARIQKFNRLGRESCFLWGPRQSGKSTLLKKLFPNAIYYDLLLSNEYARLNSNPSLLREELLASIELKGPIVIDEVQKVPALLDEIHWLIVNHKKQFILSGSSARKLKRSGANLLGGRALRYELYPLTSPEIPDFNLLRALNHGLLPRHYLSSHPQDLIAAYIGDYLKEEVAQEALTRNIPSFSRFLEAAAFSNGEMVNYKNVASECGVSAVTVKEYFQILQDTLIGALLFSYQKRPKRRVILAPKFYYFDVGIANFLLKRGPVVNRSENFGKAFEHFIFQELRAHSHYSGLNYPITTWRTASQLEVDFILGDHEIALEVKGVSQTESHHLKGLRAFQEEYPTKHAIAVTLDPRPRSIGKISVLPVELFLKKLWNNDIIH
ncbi:MAG: ATP-binding protein [Elusimicrobia bacterium]|nr:ATP-binding protein [Elusimicrobiota bacterium]